MSEVMFFSERKVKSYHQRKDLSSLSDEQYHLLFRFSRDHVKWLADHFLIDSIETRGGALKPMQKMEATLRYFANPGFQSGVANEMGLHKSTVSKTIWSTVKAIVQKGDDWIRFPNTVEEVSRAKLNWRTERGFPCTLGAIDCTHIRVEKPPLFADEYVNRKGFFSINVQATVNEKGKCYF
jgi:nuclease HARBI1